MKVFMQSEATNRPFDARDATLAKAEREAQGMSPTTRKAIIISVVFLVVLIALMVLAVWAMLQDPPRTANIRDIVIILATGVLMLTNIAIGVLMLVLVYRLQDLIHVLRTEIKPTLSNVTQTVRTVTGTAKMVSDSVAKPTIRAASIIAGVQQVARVTRRKVNERRER
jgi:hypothetical protein